jgi:hypothetical protein
MQLQFPPEHPLIIARTKVSLPKGAFIRALPFVVDETQRFRVDAMVLSADIIASAYVQLIEVALRSKWEETQNEELRSGHLDIAMFQHAWSMVDQIYSLRLLLRSLSLSGDEVDAFMSVTASAYILRNRADHLDQRIPNIATSKGSSRSLFGSLSYFVLGAAVGEPEVDVFAVAQQADPIRPGERIAEFRIPGEMRMPIGNFVLTAAGEELELDAAILKLGPVMTRTNERLEKSIRTQALEKAVEHGIEQSKLLAHHGARPKIMFALKVDKPTGQSEPADEDKEKPATSLPASQDS